MPLSSLTAPLRARLFSSLHKVRLASPVTVLLLSLGVAGVVFGLTLGFAILRPTHVNWCLGSGTDASIYYFSFAFYRHAPWAFPITRINTLFYPVGTSVTMMDGLPLLAVPLKLISRILPERFQFLGVWLFVCVWLQTFFAERFLRVLKLPAMYCWSGAIIAAIAAPFHNRFGHVALSSHWVLLAAMTAVCTELPTFALWLVPIVALWIHPYLFAITCALCLSGHLRFARTRGAPLRLLALLVGVGGSLWVLGYFNVHETKNGRFEYYSADLSTLFNSVGNAHWLPSHPLGAGSYEGYAYLGIGGLILAALLAVSCTVPHLRRKSPQNWWLLAACLLLAVYSASTAPRFLGQQLFRLDRVATLIEPLSSRFRTSGRFIWPLFYYSLFFGLKALHQLSTQRPVLRWLAPALLALQTVDLWQSLVAKDAHPEFNASEPLREVPQDIVAQLTPSTRFLIFMPPIKVRCANRAWSGPYQHLALWGAEHGLTTNANLGEARFAHADIETVCDYTQDLYRHRADHPEAIFIRR